MFEIKDLICAPAGCIALKTHAPGCVSMSSFIYNYIKKCGKSMHLPCAQLIKPVHPANKMCTPGAGCTLNFEH